MAEKKVRIREKKQRTGRKHQSLKVWEYYEVDGNSVKRKRNNCPRCGPGTMLSVHKNRKYCGRCGYTEIQKGGAPAQEAPAEEKPKDEAPAEEAKEEPKSEESESA